MNIGIISLYYKNYNYGGQLQAFALCKAIHKYCSVLGKVEQICYDNSIPGNRIIPTESFKRRFFSGDLSDKCELVKGAIVKRLPAVRYSKDISEKINTRNRAIASFSNDIIPHSQVVYNADTISESNHVYDVFITGSDQVWNPVITGSHPAYYLDFVDNNHRKIAYAASVAKGHLTLDQQVCFSKALNTFDAISIREVCPDFEKTIKNVSVVLDPTMLLGREDWDAVCAERIIDTPYYFCYFLGNDIRARRRVAKYAKEKGVPIVTLPHLLGEPRKCDQEFGEYQLYDISPAQFVSLIKYSEYVFTDSFHAAVFSHIYQTPFIIFDRKGNNNMSSRVSHLLKLLDNRNRYCAAPEFLQTYDMDAISVTTQNQNGMKLREELHKSIEFLKNSIYLM